MTPSFSFYRTRFGRLALATLCFGIGAALTGCPSSDPPKATTTAQPANASGTPAPASVAAIMEDVLPETGIAFTITKPDRPLDILETIGHGVGMIDADDDGLLDLVFVGPDQIKLFKNQGGFRFQDITAGAGFRPSGYWCAVAVGDYDNDGKPDLFVSGYDCTALYHNEGGAKFKEVTKEAGLWVRPPNKDGVRDWNSAAGFFDYDNDGNLDLYIGRYAEYGPKTPKLCGDPNRPEKFSCSPDVYVPQLGSLYRNLGGGKFKDVSSEMGVTTVSGRSLGLAFADYNDDGWTDFALANDERPGDLMENQQGKRFVNNGVASGTAFGPNGHAHGGMGADWGDYNGDGKLDLFVTTYQNEAKSLYRNMGSGLFADSALDAGLAERMDKWVSFGAKFFDYDRDAALDLMVTSGHVISNTAKIYAGTQYRQPTQLFHNQNGTLKEVTEQLSEKARRLVVGRSLCVGDLDNDGRLDVIITENEGSPLILKNNVANQNHWISLRLVGKKSARDGFGARVTVTAGGKKQLIDATNAGSYASANDPRIYFGLGAETQVTSIEVRWTNGAKQTFTNLAADTFYRLEEGKAQPEVWKIPGAPAPN